MYDSSSSTKYFLFYYLFRSKCSIIDEIISMWYLKWQISGLIMFLISYTEEFNSPEFWLGPHHDQCKFSLTILMIVSIFAVISDFRFWYSLGLLVYGDQVNCANLLVAIWKRFIIWLAILWTFDLANSQTDKKCFRITNSHILVLPTIDLLAQKVPIFRRLTPAIATSKIHN